MRIISKIIVFALLSLGILMLSLLFYNSSTATDITVSNEIATFINTNFRDYNIDYLSNSLHDFIDMIVRFFQGE